MKKWKKSKLRVRTYNDYICFTVSRKFFVVIMYFQHKYVHKYTRVTRARDGREVMSGIYFIIYIL